MANVKVNLSQRLQTICQMVPGGTVADVGCDHGFCSIYLVEENICERAIAMDVRSGPLDRARAHVLEHGLGDKIDLRLGNGLGKLLPGEATGCIIAGMGGPLMQDILKAGKEIACEMEYLILQPQSEIPQFRKFLRESGFRIEENRVLFEEGIFYFPMKVRPALKSDKAEVDSRGMDMEQWLVLSDMYGEDLLTKGSDLGDYLIAQRKQYESILEKLPQGEAYDERRREVREILTQNEIAKSLVL